MPVGTSSLKIKTQKGDIFVGNESTDTPKIVILEDNTVLNTKYPEDTLVIYGPGDFEASGILIKGTRTERSTMYTIESNDGTRVLYVVSDSISNLSEENDYQAIIVKATGPVTDTDLSSLSSSLVVVFGEEKNIPETFKVSKINKVNLKKKDEAIGNLVYLSK